MTRRRPLWLLVLVALTLGLVPPLGALTSAIAAPAVPATLTNTAHLDFLRAQVTPPAQPGHTTYRLADRPSIGQLWTYSEPGPDWTWTRVGGGTYDPASNTWGQGAYNADDVSRAAVVYLRHWRQTGSLASRAAAFELLRGLTYLQTASGPNRGNVVLWMQPDGTLNPSPVPKELPDPSDSDASYWLARTIWALGEGYAAFRGADPSFAAFLRQRMELAIGAVERQVLVRYGTFQVVDGQRTPAWLIVNGADATAEAVLGLAAYVDSGGGRAGTALRQLAEGIALLSGGDARHWPFGAVRPWALSRSVWHAWASQMPAALARAGTVLRDSSLIAPAVQDAAVFTPWLMTSGGPDNGRLPTPTERNQIAYGVDSRVQSLLAVSAATHRAGFRRLAGMTAAWFFGANAAGITAYDRTTGTTVDTIEANGNVNRNSGAESTIHALLTMLALDANPDVAALAMTAGIRERVGTTTVEAESAALSGGATMVRPASDWTGESKWSGAAYASIPTGGSVSWELAASDQPRLVLPVIDLQPGSDAETVWTSGDRRLGRARTGDVGAQGASPAPGALLPVTLRRVLPAGATSLSTGGRQGTTSVDAVMLEPLVSRLVLGTGDHGTALLRSAARSSRSITLAMPGIGPSIVEVYDSTGQLRARYHDGSGDVTARVLPGGFTVIRR